MDYKEEKKGIFASSSWDKVLSDFKERKGHFFLIFLGGKENAQNNWQWKPEWMKNFYDAVTCFVCQIKSSAKDAQ